MHIMIGVRYINNDDETSHMNGGACERFIAELKPNRSTNPRTLNHIGVIIAGATSIITTFFFSLGAWPISGFLGLDAILLYGALYFHAHAPLPSEIIEISPEKLIIKHKTKYGNLRQWQFPPQWVKVTLKKDIEREIIGDLLIRSHGRTIRIGDFLSAEEKESIAHHIQNQLSRIPRP